MPMQLIDARDLAAFLLDCGRARHRRHLQRDRAAAATRRCGSWLARLPLRGDRRRTPTLTWVDDDVLLAHEVEPWTELPLWMPLPAQDGDHVWDADTSGAAADRAAAAAR